MLRSVKRIASPGVLVPALLLSFSALPVVAQTPSQDVSRTQVTRASLEALLAQFDSAVASSAFSTEFQAQARSQAELIRTRLRDGDFQIGDRILLRVYAETALTDTFTVTAGRVVTLPGVGDVPLSGVLRTELRDHVEAHLRRFLRTPRVESATALIRVAVLGEVARQGFYTVPTELLLEDVLMQAGGPSGLAQLDQMYIERGDERLWEGDLLQRAITEGRTLDALNIQAGDRFIVPRQVQRNWESTVRTVGFLLSLPLTIYGLTRLFK